MHFSFRQKVLFRHCDPAGIVFYPRYLEMLNDAVEDLFSDRLGWPFEIIHREGGVPTVALNIVFNAPSRHGDVLDLEITLLRLGRSSLGLRTIAQAGTEQRFKANHTLVYTGPDGRPRPWPDPVRATLSALMENNA